jgi:SAM-dependent methyltransferase
MEPTLSESATLERILAARRSALGARFPAHVAVRFHATVELLPPPPATVLDVGCGAGVLTDYLTGLGYQATGADVNEPMMAQMSSPHVSSSIDELPFSDGSFNAVVASEVMEHLPVEVYERARVELARVAADVIVVTVPNRESLESATTRCPQCGCVYSVHGHVRRFDDGTLAALLPGWRLTALEQAGPHKMRHRSFEWFIRRRLLGRWPTQAGRECPQCGYRQPGTPSGEGPGADGGLLRRLAGVPWRHRWWLVARYEPTS